MKVKVEVEINLEYKKYKSGDMFVCFKLNPWAAEGEIFILLNECLEITSKIGEYQGWDVYVFNAMFAKGPPRGSLEFVANHAIEAYCKKVT